MYWLHSRSHWACQLGLCNERNCEPWTCGVGSHLTKSKILVPVVDKDECGTIRQKVYGRRITAKPRTGKKGLINLLSDCGGNRCLYHHWGWVLGSIQSCKMETKQIRKSTRSQPKTLVGKKTQFATTSQEIC